jgi:hypothetical protein
LPSRRYNPRKPGPLSLQSQASARFRPGRAVSWARHVSPEAAMRTRSLLLAGTLALFAISAAHAGKVGSNCTYKGKKLYGKIQVVNSFPDIKVQVVNSFPDLKVQVVNSFPDKCGKWQMVNSFPNTKIQFVNSFPDIKIQYVTSFPGRVK